MNLHYEIFGSKQVDIVVEMGLLACLEEWRAAAKMLAFEKHGVLVYERAGIGTSEACCAQRTPKNIAKELHELLSRVSHANQVILIGHSQGGLYVQQFARMYPEMTKGIVLLDPLSSKDNNFKLCLSKEEYKKGGVDKSANIVLVKKLLKLHLGFVVKAALKNAPPMYYYNFNTKEKEYILNSMIRPEAYETAEQEYECAHKEEFLTALRDKESFPEIPIALITHSSKRSEKEIMEFGRASAGVARKVEKLWQELMKESLEYSKTVSWTRAEKSTHYIHLMQPEIVVKAVNWVEKQKK